MGASLFNIIYVKISNDQLGFILPLVLTNGNNYLRFVGMLLRRAGHATLDNGGIPLEPFSSLVLAFNNHKDDK